MHTTHYVSIYTDTATFLLCSLSLHDALPIYCGRRPPMVCISVHLHNTRLKSLQRQTNGESLGSKICAKLLIKVHNRRVPPVVDRKSTRLNSSHLVTSYAVFCLKKKMYR